MTYISNLVSNIKNGSKKGQLWGLAALLLLTVIPSPRAAAEEVRSMYFPLITNNARYSNDFDSPRSGGPHHATDIVADKMTPIISATSGTIIFVASPQPSYGYMVSVRDDDGYRYNYLHINNDTPGTDDGAGGEMNAYAPDIKRNNRIEKGQLIGWVGDSGNAESTVSHLHFEIEAPNGNSINPYFSLQQAPRVGETSLYPPLSGETLPFWVAYRGGLNVASGHFDANASSETAVSGGAGGPPVVWTYTNDNKLLGGITAYDPRFLGGIDVALGDVTGDGIDEIITGPGAGGGPWVRVFNLQGQVLQEFPAYGLDFMGGIDVATADTNDSTAKEIITGPGKTGGPWIRIFKPNGDKIKEFPVYDLSYDGGIRVSGGNVKSNSAKDEIMSIPATLGESRVRLMANTGANIEDYPYLETWWKGYYDVAAGDGDSKVVSGVNRRGSMRDGPN